MAKRRYKRNSNKGKLTFLLVVGLAIIFTVLGVTVKQLFVGFIIAASIAVALGLLVGILNLPSIKGKRGERKIANLLQSLAANKEAYVINDVIVATDDGNTSQIDHILFARGGIFVIETKNYSGRIYGTDNQREWTQVLAYGKTKNKFYNPVKQNQTHIYRLKEILGKQYPFVSCVVFLRADISNADSEYIFTPKELKKYLKSEAFAEKIDHNDVYDAYSKIYQYKEKPIQTTKEHIQEIKQTQKNINSLICPRCGGQLVLRRSKDGREFYGCSNFPKCKFTKRK